MTISHIYDTYAKAANGKILHFDVVIDEQDQEKALQCAKMWLTSIGYADATVNLSNCAFCHSAEATPTLRKEIDERGYGIYKLEGCPK
jgi:hypothetical protein